jgi:hypothetical protein
MTPQEESMLNDLVRRVQQTQLTEKDPQAQQLLDEQLGGNPDSLYILSQTVLVQKYALEQAQRRIEQLQQQQTTQPAKTTSFLGNLFGHREEASPAQQPYAQQQQSYAPPQPPPYAPVNQPGYTVYPPPAYPAAGYPPQGYAPSGGSSFLRSAATTAAGVAAGALAFEGVESLMHGFGHSAGFGGGFGEPYGGGFSGMGGGFGERPIEENVVNNYYDSPGGEHEHHFDGGSDRVNDFGDRGDTGLHDANFGGSDNDLQPQLDQADDVNIGDDGSDAYDDASNSGGDDFGGGGDDSSFV